MSLKTKAFPFLGIPLALMSLGGCGGSSDVNRAPLASVSGDAVRKTHVGNVVKLDGSLSVDPDGDVLRYDWRLKTPVGSQARIVGEGAEVSFTPDLLGEYDVQLLVADERQTSVVTVVEVQVGPENTAPTADAGHPRYASVGALTMLDGSQSHDGESDPLTYRWTLVLPANSRAVLSGGAMEVAGFVPDVAGVYVATLVVSDGLMESAADTISIVATNDAPSGND
jgi:hypothetical protein